MKFKKTTPIHYLCGIITVLSGVLITGWLTALCFGSFLTIEIWTKKEWQESQNDFWEYVAAIFATIACLIIARLIQVVFR